MPDHPDNRPEPQPPDPPLPRPEQRGGPLPAHVQRLVDAHDRVAAILRDGNPRDAAGILCDEFNALLAEADFWNTAVADLLDDHRAQAQDLLHSIRDLVEAEMRIFDALGIEENRSGPILTDVYGGLDLATVATDDRSVRAAVTNVRNRLAQAAALVCAERHGRARRAADWLLAWAGRRVLAGAASAAVNAAAYWIVQDSGALALVSAKAGFIAMETGVDWIDRLGG